MARAILLIDIKEYLIALEEKVDFFHNIDDDTMDQMMEVVEAIKGNAELLESKIDRSEIVDNLESDATDKPLSARQGRELEDSIFNVWQQIPKVYDWAKQPSKPAYTASEVGADAAGSAAGVQKNLTAHTTNEDIHLKGGERDKWNAIKSVVSVVQTVKGSGSDAANVWTMTFSDGTTSTITVKNGEQGATGKEGPKGERGEPFAIAKTYSSVSAMNAGYATDGVAIGSFVVIDTGNVEDEENARLYLKGESRYVYLTDLSGAKGLQGPQGPQGSQGPEGSDGDPGERGTGILKVTTSPASYTTSTGGKNPIKRMALSTIKSQSNVNEVLVGDIIAYSYYHYHVYYIDATYAYMDTYTSIRGATGASGAAGTNGKDYVLTAADKVEIAESIKGSLGFEEWSFELEDGTIVTKKVFAVTEADNPDEPDEPELTPSEGLQFAVDTFDHSAAVLIGTGTCKDKQIVVPSTWEGLPVKSMVADANYPGAVGIGGDFIEKLILPDSMISCYKWGISYTPSLTYIKFGKYTEYISGDMSASGIFGTPLELDFSDYARSTPPVLTGTTLLNTATKIKVPSGMLDQWQSATNWDFWINSGVYEGV